MIEEVCMKVFLGGTCSGYKWRDDFIKMIDCDYYNPIVKKWSETDRLKEVAERENDDIILYTITSGIKGVYSIAEVIDDSNKRPNKTVLCILKEGMNKQMYHSLRAVVNLARGNGIKVFFSLKDTAEYINRMNK